MEAGGEYGGSGGDEAIYQYGRAVRGGAETESAHGTDFETAETGKQANRVGDAGAVKGKGALDGRALASETGFVGAGSASDDGGGFAAGESGGEGAGGSGVADAHLAHADEGAAGGRSAVGRFDSKRQRRDGLVARHGGLEAEVLRTEADGTADEAGGFGNRVGDSGIDNFQLHAGDAGERVDGGASAQEVSDHLSGDGLWIGVDALGADAVIGGEQDDAGLLDGGRESGLNSGDAVGDLFQAAETAGGLREFKLARAGASHPVGVHRLDAFESLVQIRHG